MERAYLIIILVINFLCYSGGVDAQQHQVTLVYAAELPLIESEDYGSYANLASLLTQQREQNNSTIFLFGGGSLAPSMLSSFDRGAHIIDILNSLEPDAMAVSKREFSFFEDELSLRAYEAAFPLVLTNATDPVTQGNIDGIKKQILFEKDGINIGVMAIIDNSVVEEYLLQRLIINPPLNAIESSAAQLRAEGAELIVAMFSDDHPAIKILLEKNIIDLALQTDPYTTLSAQQLQEKPSHYIFINKPGSAAVINISWNNNNTHSYKQINSEYVSLDTLPPLDTFDSIIQTYNSRISALLNEEITVLATPMITTRTAVRTSENGFGNIVSDALREASHTDVAMINGGAIRGERHYATGHTLTREDISAELPFRSHIKVLRIKGKDIKSALENGISQLEDVSGRFPHVSGMRFTAKLDAPEGHRIQQLIIGDEPFKPETTYTLATSDFLAGGGDGYVSLKNAEQVAFSQQVTPLIADIVISVIRRHPTLHTQTNNRITLIPKQGVESHEE